MAKWGKKTTEPAKPSRAFQIAMAKKLPLLTDAEYKALQQKLGAYGVKFNAVPVRAGDYKEGREPFALQVGVSGFTVLVDLTVPDGTN